MRAGLGLALGGCIAVAIACGGATRKATAPQATSAGADSMPAVAGNARAEIDQLDAAIRADLARMGLPAPAPATCSGDACAPQQMGAQIKPPGADAACQPGTSDTCRDSCTLATSICENATKICQLAADLGGNDTWANGKCVDGNTSCDNAKQRCCGCQV